MNTVRFIVGKVATFSSQARLVVVSVGVALCLVASLKAEETATIEVDAGRPGHAISPMLYGLMTEEINHAYDGGLYGELIRNRAFKDSRNNIGAWSETVSVGAVEGSIDLDDKNPVNKTGLPVSLKVEVKEVPNDGFFDVQNEGFWGLPVRPSTDYKLSFYARGDGNFTGPLEPSFQNTKGTTLLMANHELITIGKTWKKYTATMRTADNFSPITSASLHLRTYKPGTFHLSLVSLFGPTYKNRPNGNRVDLMELMAEMHPAFLRFPGGNYLEGDTIAERFDWKKTIGPLEDRPGHRCCWNYPSSDGFGLMEFLGWCEDLNMEPVLAVYAGYSLKGEHVEKPEELKPFIQDALDEIEFVSGAADTTWGRKRAELGHAAPFKLQYVEIGNEDSFDKSKSYDRRFAQFHDAIKAKYPQLQLIATMPVKSCTADVVDDHYYKSAVEMQGLAHRYDKTDRNGPKIFVGEWATTEGKPTPIMNAALGDAAFMTGLERNSDVVVISCYAPLFVNVNKGASQWPTNLIGYDALSSFGSPAYYAQVMFSQNRGDVVLPTTIDAGKVEVTFSRKVKGKPEKVTEHRKIDPLYGTASRDKASGDVILKLVNVTDEPYETTIKIDGAGKIDSQAKAIVLSGERKDQNSVAEPRKVAPKEEAVTNASANFMRTLPARSVTVLRLKAE